MMLKIIISLLLLVAMSCSLTNQPKPVSVPSTDPSPLITFSPPEKGNTHLPIATPKFPIESAIPLPTLNSETPEISPSPRPLVEDSPARSTPTPLSTSPPIANSATSLPNTWREGHVYDDQGNPLEGVSIIADPTTSTIPKKIMITDKNGYYRLPLYAEISYLVTAYKLGYTKRNTILVGKFALDPGDNTFNFGASFNTPNTAESESERAYALSNEPEITKFKLDQRETGDFTQTDIILYFSEPMDTSSVDSSILIRAFNSPQLSIDTLTNSTETTFLGSQKSGAQATTIFDSQHFQTQWNDTHDQVKLILKEGLLFPSDRVDERRPDYELGFKGVIRDKSGNARNSYFFNLNGNGNYDAVSFKQFSIPPDQNKPDIIALEQQNVSSLLVKYSEPMIIRTLSRSIAGGLKDRFNVPGSEKEAPAEHSENKGNASARNAAKNYTLIITPGSGSNTQPYQGSWFGLSGKALYADDPTSVVLLAPQNESGSSINNWVRRGAIAQLKTSQNQIIADAQDNSTWNFGWKLVKPDGTVSPVFLSGDLESAQGPQNASNLATALVAQLNAALFTTQLTLPTSANPWVVNASSDNTALEITFKDTSGNYVGWQLTGGNYLVNAQDVLPTILVDSQTWTPAESLKIFSSGDNITLEVAPTVVDPAGNVMNPDKRKMTLQIQ